MNPATVIEQMNEANVDKLMLCGWHRPNKVLIPNDIIAKYVAHDPNRFKGIVSIDLKNPLKALDEIDYCQKKKTAKINLDELKINSNFFLYFDCIM